jgi:hypothetical protein
LQDLYQLAKKEKRKKKEEETQQEKICNPQLLVAKANTVIPTYESVIPSETLLFIASILSIVILIFCSVSMEMT